MGNFISSMRRFGVLFLFLLSASCGTISSTSETEPALSSSRPATTPSRTPAPPEQTDVELEAVIRKIAETAGGKVGVGAVFVETGQSAWLEREGHFPSQSVYKLPIAMTVLKMVDDGKVRIDQEITITPDDFVRRGFHSPIRNVNPAGTIMPLNEVIRYSISESDGTASDVLLDLAGGPAAVQNYLTQIGINNFIVADSEKSISKDWETQYRNWATPAASIDLLRALHEQNADLSDWTATMLLRVMTESETGRRRLKRGLPDGSSLAHKTGTGGRRTEVPGFRRDANTNVNTNRTTNQNSKLSAYTNRGSNRSAGNIPSVPPNSDAITSATNDIGIVTLPDGRHILIAVYVMDSAADSATRERVIADIAKAVCDRWTNSASRPSSFSSVIEN